VPVDAELLLAKDAVLDDSPLTCKVHRDTIFSAVGREFRHQHCIVSALIRPQSHSVGISRELPSWTPFQRGESVEREDRTAKSKFRFVSL
jgi:hypothetical protein